MGSCKDGLDKGQKWYGPKKKQKILRGGRNTQKNCTKKIFMTKIITMVWSLTYTKTSWNVKSSGPCTAAVATKLLQSCPPLCNPIDGSPPGSCPWDSPGKSTGVGCHFLLQCMKVKSKREVAQSCLTLSDPMDSSLPGSSTHGSPVPSPMTNLDRI